MAAKSSQNGIPKPHVPQAPPIPNPSAGDPRTLAEGWEHYLRANLGPGIRQMPAVMKIARAAYLAGAGEATLQIGEARDKAAKIRELCQEYEAGSAKIVSPR